MAAGRLLAVVLAQVDGDPAPEPTRSAWGGDPVRHPLAYAGVLVLAVRASRNPELDLEDPYCLQWGCDREDAIEGAVSSFATGPAIDARYRHPLMIRSAEDLTEDCAEAVEELDHYWERRGGMNDEHRVVCYVARRFDHPSHEGEDLVTPLLLVQPELADGMDVGEWCSAVVRHVTSIVGPNR